MQSFPYFSSVALMASSLRAKYRSTMAASVGVDERIGLSFQGSTYYDTDGNRNLSDSLNKK